MSSTEGNGTRLWVKVTLFVSLAVNLAILGIVTGFVLKGGPDGRDHRQSDLRGSLFVQGLEHEARRDLGRALREEGIGRREQRENMRRNAEAVISALRTVPFDIDAFVAGVEDRHQISDAQRIRAQEVFISHVEAMSDAERAAFADRLEAILKEPRKDRRP